MRMRALAACSGCVHKAVLVYRHNLLIQNILCHEVRPSSIPPVRNPGYGSYDYIEPQIFRISSTALSLGTTAQWWLSKTVALQGTALAGVGYGAGGTIHGLGERDYHYGLTPQGLLALRLIFGDTASLDVSGRDYYVSRVASTESRGRENIARAEVSFTWRL
jgi:hypothetical protein